MCTAARGEGGRAVAAEWICTTHPLMASSMDMMKLPLQFHHQNPSFLSASKITKHLGLSANPKTR
jgi:hypothetical protein